MSTHNVGLCEEISQNKILLTIIKCHHDKTGKIACEHSRDSDQMGISSISNLIQELVNHMKSGGGGGVRVLRLTNS